MKKFWGRTWTRANLLLTQRARGCKRLAVTPQVDRSKLVNTVTSRWGLTCSASPRGTCSAWEWTKIGWNARRFTALQKDTSTRKEALARPQFLTHLGTFSPYKIPNEHPEFWPKNQVWEANRSFMRANIYSVQTWDFCSFCWGCEFL